MIVVDASVLLELLLHPRNAEVIADRVLAATEVICAPHLLDVEITQVVRRYCLFGDLTGKRGAEALQDLADFPIERFPHTPFLPRIWELRDNLTAYDAAYIALAETLECPLLTRDHKLAKSPIHIASVEVL